MALMGLYESDEERKNRERFEEKAREIKKICGFVMKDGTCGLTDSCYYGRGIYCRLDECIFIKIFKLLNKMR